MNHMRGTYRPGGGSTCRLVHASRNKGSHRNINNDRYHSSKFKPVYQPVAQVVRIFLRVNIQRPRTIDEPYPGVRANLPFAPKMPLLLKYLYSSRLLIFIYQKYSQKKL